LCATYLKLAVTNEFYKFMYGAQDCEVCMSNQILITLK